MAGEISATRRGEGRGAGTAGPTTHRGPNYGGVGNGERHDARAQQGDAGKTDSLEE